MKRSAFTDRALELKSVRLRKRLLEIIYHAGAGHTGGSLSCVDILNVLYNRVLRVSPETFSDPSRDRYIQSKGHSVEALYVVLADCGFFPESELETLCQYRSPFVGHPTRKVRGIEMNTGALGHGLPICVGLALAAKLNAIHPPEPLARPGETASFPQPSPPEKERENRTSLKFMGARREPGRGKLFRVVTLLGDGELAEGSNWEAAMAAAHYKLDNLTAVIDHNTLQITGHTREVCSNEPLDEKLKAFGWDVHTIDGHSIPELTQALMRKSGTGKPGCVIANTRKGRGVSFMENVAKWHHGVPNAGEFHQAMAELSQVEAGLKG